MRYALADGWLYAPSFPLWTVNVQCPVCGQQMTDVTEAWHTFVEAEGAEYLADYVTIWRCSHCQTVAGADDGTVEWIMESETVAAEEQ